ncbi:MAG: hypothetical protein U0K80_06935 [Methanobrevibacter sp.]|nr:hypothetical protein [Methanobrevibacter sp.]
MIGIFLFFIFFYIGVFGTSNMMVGMTIAMAAFMNLGNDFTYNPKI